MKKIAFGSDHAGYEMKEALKKYLAEKGEYEIQDFGTDSDASCDYPEFAKAVAEAVLVAFPTTEATNVRVLLAS